MIAPQGRIALINAEAADLFVFRPKSVSIHFELMFTRPLLQTADIEAQHRLLNEVADLVDSGRVRSTMRENYGRIDAANLMRAMRFLKSGRAIGKIVLAGFSSDRWFVAFRAGFDTTRMQSTGVEPSSRRLERQAMLGLGDAQPSAAHEDVHMRERLAEGEGELVRVVDCASENDRHEFGDGLRPLFARLDNRHAARLMVGDQLVCARVQADERQPVPWQNQHVLRQRRASAFRASADRRRADRLADPSPRR